MVEVNLKQRLEQIKFEEKLKDKYSDFPGIKSYRLFFGKELTKPELDATKGITKINSIPSEKIMRDGNRDRNCDWVTVKLQPYLNCQDEFIIGDVAVILGNPMLFLKNHLKDSCDIRIIHRNAGKLFMVLETEYFLEFFIKDI